MFLDYVCSFGGGVSRNVFGPFKDWVERESFRNLLENNVLSGGDDARIVIKFISTAPEGAIIIHPRSVPEFLLCSGLN